MLGEGTIALDTPEFEQTLARSSQTVASLESKRGGQFDFTPGDVLVARSRDACCHLGDLDLRVRSGRTALLHALAPAEIVVVDR